MCGGQCRQQCSSADVGTHADVLIGFPLCLGREDQTISSARRARPRPVVMTIVRFGNNWDGKGNDTYGDDDDGQFGEHPHHQVRQLLLLLLVPA